LSLLRQDVLVQKAVLISYVFQKEEKYLKVYQKLVTFVIASFLIKQKENYLLLANLVKGNGASQPEDLVEVTF
jgi:hypothetical protein